MGLIRDWRIKRRADRLLAALDKAAANPDLYLDPEWRDEAAHRAADVIEVVPMPSPARNLLMNFLTNWKTTLSGLGLSFASLVIAAMQGGVKPKDAVVAAGLALVGSLAKDANVTGGTVKQ